ncbi:MAG: hypothetical protein IKP02_10670 [Paludibacteraceae bacterium]|nr:hypothetical protein [Paludibacteraceae bacterium]
MKKIFFLVSAMLIGSLLMTSCFLGTEKEDEDATLKSVRKHLPGTWQVTDKVASDGTETKYEYDITLTFGEEGTSSPKISVAKKSDIYGSLKMYHISKYVISKGRWNLEDDNMPLLYIHDDLGNLSMIPGATQNVYVRKIGISYMYLDFEKELNGFRGYKLKRQ